MKDQATARPWRVETSYGQRLEIRADSNEAGWRLTGITCNIAINGSGPKFGPHWLVTPEQAHANAALIVRAVNSHETLIAALKAMAEIYDHAALGPLMAAAKYGPDYTPPTDEECLRARQMAHDALALAEGSK